MLNLFRPPQKHQNLAAIRRRHLNAPIQQT
jgi:hypothetical protein